MSKKNNGAQEIILDAEGAGFITWIPSLRSMTLKTTSEEKLNAALAAAGFELEKRERPKSCRPGTLVTRVLEDMASRGSGQFVRCLGKKEDGKRKLKGATRAVFELNVSADGEDADPFIQRKGKMVHITKAEDAHKAKLKQHKIKPDKDGFVPLFEPEQGSDRYYASYNDRLGEILALEARNWLIDMLCSIGLVVDTDADGKDVVSTCIHMSPQSLYVPDDLKDPFDALAGVLQQECGFDFVNSTEMLRRNLVSEAEEIIQEIRDAFKKPTDPKELEKWVEPSKRKKWLNERRRRLDKLQARMAKHADEQKFDLEKSIQTVKKMQATIGQTILMGA